MSPSDLPDANTKPRRKWRRWIILGVVSLVLPLACVVAKPLYDRHIADLEVTAGSLLTAPWRLNVRG
jgi:hypothetical protein